jgi:cephalosporin hydroxylase
MINSAEQSGPGDLLSFTQQFTDGKLRRQDYVPTYYDNHLRRLVAACQQPSAGAKPEEPLGDPSAHAELARFAELAGQERFQDPLPRLSRGTRDVIGQMALNPPVYSSSQGVLSAIYWQGKPLFKTVYDLAAYPMLIAELRPRTIIELGSGSGASAIWLAGMADCHGVKSSIISIDRRPVDVADSRVKFLKGDIARLDGLLDPHIASLDHPWLVIEDAHAHVAKVLAYFDRHLRSGDYLIIEDSLPKRSDLLQFCRAAPDRYHLDTLYLDLFGQNTTCAIDSIFRRA